MPYKDKDKQREIQKQYYLNTVAELQRLKESTPCVDCGENFPHYKMDFDHVPERGVKLFNIQSGGVNRYFNNKRLQAELAKCDIVCKNCHGERTYFRRLTNLEL